MADTSIRRRALANDAALVAALAALTNGDSVTITYGQGLYPECLLRFYRCAARDALRDPRLTAGAIAVYRDSAELSLNFVGVTLASIDALAELLDGQSIRRETY